MASMTFNEFRVIRTLLDSGSLPHIISSTSGDSLAVSVVEVRTDDELPADGYITIRLENGQYIQLRGLVRESIDGDETVKVIGERGGLQIYNMDCDADVDGEDAVDGG